MSLIKKVDVPKYFAARRAIRLVTDRPANQPIETGGERIEQACGRTSPAEFIEDLSREHSTSIAPATAEQ